MRWVYKTYAYTQTRWHTRTNEGYQVGPSDMMQMCCFAPAAGVNRCLPPPPSDRARLILFRGRPPVSQGRGDWPALLEVICVVKVLLSRLLLTCSLAGSPLLAFLQTQGCKNRALPSRGSITHHVIMLPRSKNPRGSAFSVLGLVTFVATFDPHPFTLSRVIIMHLLRSCNEYRPEAPTSAVMDSFWVLGTKTKVYTNLKSARQSVNPESWSSCTLAITLWLTCRLL